MQSESEPMMQTLKDCIVAALGHLQKQIKQFELTDEVEDQMRVVCEYVEAVGRVQVTDEGVFASAVDTAYLKKTKPLLSALEGLQGEAFSNTSTKQHLANSTADEEACHHVIRDRVTELKLNVGEFIKGLGNDRGNSGIRGMSGR